MSGAWGFLLNNYGAIWPSGLAAESGYGLWSTTQLPFLCALGAGDIVEVRSGKLIEFSPSVSATLGIATMGSATSPIVFRIDDSTTWSDGSNPVLQLYKRATAGGLSMQMQFSNASGYAHIKGRRYSDGNTNLLFRFDATSATAGLSVQYAGPVLMEGFELRSESVNAPVFLCGFNGINSAPAGYTILKTFKVRKVTQDNANPFVRFINPYKYRADFIDFEFDCGTPSAVQNPVIDLYYGVNEQNYRFMNGRFANFVVGSRLHPAKATLTQERFSAVFTNCDFGNVTVLGPTFFGSTGQLDGNIGGRGHFASSQFGNQDFFVDTPAGYVEWCSTRSYPTLNAKLRDGVTPWSIRAIPAQSGSAIAKQAPLELPRISKFNSLSDGIRTLTFEFGVEQSLAWTKADISLRIAYQDTSGLMRYQDTYDPAGSALDVSTASWSNASGAQFTFSDSGTIYFNKKKFAVTTDYPVKSGTEISVWPQIHAVVANSTKQVFIDPEIGVA